MRADLLHVIAVVNNPERWKSRVALYKKFAAHMADSGVHLITVEHAFGDRPFEVTDAANPDHVQVRGGRSQEIWMKEALVNVGIRQNLTRRFPDWKYVAWVDADVQFLHPDWAAETIHELQHVAVCQPWTHCVDLGPQHQIIENENGKAVDRSFAAAYLAGEAHLPGSQVYGKDCRQHYGYAWAATREAVDGIGGLMDWVVVGSADYYMANSFAGLAATSDGRLPPGFARRLEEFHARAQRVVKRRLGVVPGTLVHGWHGPKRKRGYLSRDQILIDSNFNPDVDLAYDAAGLPYLCTDNYPLRDGMRAYFQSRNEDGVDV